MTRPKSDPAKLLEAATADGVPDARGWREWTAGLDDDQKRRKDVRYRVVATAMLAGVPMREAAAVLGCTGERTRQIGKAMGIAPRGIAAERKALARQHEQQRRDRVADASRRLAGLPLADVARDAGVTPSEAKHLLGHRALIHEPSEHGWGHGAVPTDDELVDMLRRWAAGNPERHSMKAYDDWARGTQARGSQTMAIRFGSWGNAMRRAGIGDRFTPSAVVNYSRKGHTEVLGSLVAFLLDEQPSYTNDAYCRWSGPNGAASAATVRQRLGTWVQAMEQARLVLAYRSTGKTGDPVAEAVLAVADRILAGPAAA